MSARGDRSFYQTGCSVNPDLEQALDATLLVHADGVGGRLPWQARHRHDFSADKHDKLGTCGQTNFTNRHMVAARRAEQIWIG